jgi:predicted RNA binding protein YcfA (HicA-like mRNA interferase family)
MTKIYSIKEQMIIIKRNGFECVRSGKGSHEIWAKGSVKISIVVGHEFKTSTFLRICKEAGIDINVLDKKYWKEKFQ